MGEDIYICSCGFKFIKGQARKTKNKCPKCSLPIEKE